MTKDSEPNGSKHSLNLVIYIYIYIYQCVYNMLLVCPVDLLRTSDLCSPCDGLSCATGGGGGIPKVQLSCFSSEFKWSCIYDNRFVQGTFLLDT
jgi:hypothetical protein